MKILLDNGHGIDTPGKRSPVYNGKQLFEWKFTRDIVKELSEELNLLGISNVILVPEDIDISLGERCRRANKEYSKDKTCILLSIHANAGGGTGFECFTSKGTTKSDQYATIICNEFKLTFPTKKMRFDFIDSDPDKEEDFFILKNTNCPAMLLENFFMDNIEDFNLINSDIGKQQIVTAIINAIKKFS